MVEIRLNWDLLVMRPVPAALASRGMPCRCSPCTCVRSYMITSPSFPSDLGSGAAAPSMCLCGAKPALRIHKLLRTAGARNSSLLRRKHYRDDDRAAQSACLILPSFF